ncbi:class I SAM-dependent methyltransferase [Paenibacillus sp. NPDC058071]|uniref:class I SAM-dependent methyltransferase n=1 Tax=Paenibacillus sp. NPDC058071 TaxID=3346326 RepID=UPI0036DB2138
MNWKYYDPYFSADRAHELPIEFMQNGAWSGHRRFAYDLVRNMKPRVVTELGTLYGTSFFSFCQAVKDGALNTKCFAVDTWFGDGHTGAYDDSVFLNVQLFNNRIFSGIGHLLRGTFDQALPLFADGSVDVLHIDGFHTYEAVLHDLQTWLPKVAEGGVILFHDIMVRMSDFGVYKLWEQLRDYPRLEFAHSNGLGVLFPKGCPASLSYLIERQDDVRAHYSNNWS